MKKTGRKKARKGVEAQCRTRAINRFLTVSAHIWRNMSTILLAFQHLWAPGEIVSDVVRMYQAMMNAMLMGRQALKNTSTAELIQN